ncbi:hypothetical protein ACFWPQ_20535 [Streptomyces sp. NPDC058464]
MEVTEFPRSSARPRGLGVVNPALRLPRHQLEDTITETAESLLAHGIGQ